jgi:tRNA(Ile)-lysidine synthase
MAALGPFEPEPRLAVAVSGGPDSLALALLAKAWARVRGGTVTALTVDHGLRPESGAEAAKVAGWMRRHELDHRVLRTTRPGDRPANQATARELRYRLLGAAVREAGILHLLLAHHLDDQIETAVLRRARASALRGMAGMAAIVEMPDFRILRPLLGVPRSRLAATLRACGQGWIEDPSNRDPRFARVRVRDDLAARSRAVPRLAALVTGLGRRRARHDAIVDRAAGRFVSVHPAGYARVRMEGLLREAPEWTAALLSRVVTCIGGRGYAPGRTALGRTRDRLAAGDRQTLTLGRCRLMRRGAELLVCRELRDLPRQSIGSGERARWDGRFEVSLPEEAPDDVWTVEALGLEGWRTVLRLRPELRGETVVSPPCRPWVSWRTKGSRA